MKILFITPSYKPAYVYGGTTVAVAQLAEALCQEGQEVTVYTTTANGKEELKVNVSEKTVVDQVGVYYFKRWTKDHTHLSWALLKAVFNNCKKFDIVHIHSWWSPLILLATFLCWCRGVRPVLSPHGMLSPYIFQQNHSLVKKCLHQTVGLFLLKKTYLHVSTTLEREECLQVYGDWENSIISNIIQFPRQQLWSKRPNDTFTIGFLSRIDHKKGLDLLLKGLSKITWKYKLLIAGAGGTSYVNDLKHLIKELNIEDKVEWVGWKNETSKFDFLNALNVFVLPSRSENFAIVVLESLYVGTPVLLSDKVGLCDFVAQHQLGWVSNNEPTQLFNLLNEIYKQEEQRNWIERHAKETVVHTFDTSKIARQYIQFYQSLTQKI